MPEEKFTFQSLFRKRKRSAVCNSLKSLEVRVDEREDEAENQEDMAKERGAQIELLKEEIRSEKERVERYKNCARLELFRADEYRESLESGAKTIIELQERVFSLEREIRSADHKREDCKKYVESLILQLNQLEKKNEEWRNFVDAVEERMNISQLQNDNLRHTLEHIPNTNFSASICENCSSISID